jgi:hypothetical protein
VVGLRTDNFNFRSQRAIEGLGAKKDGVIRHHALRRDGTVRDTVMYSILAAEWRDVRRHLELRLDRHAAQRIEEGSQWNVVRSVRSAALMATLAATPALRARRRPSARPSRSRPPTPPTRASSTTCSATGSSRRRTSSTEDPGPLERGALDKGQILDEYRVTGDDGETYYVTTTLRNWNGALDRWELIGATAERDCRTLVRATGMARR